MIKKIKLHWITPLNPNAAADSLGYATHVSMMKKYGARYFKYDENADIALTITSGDLFQPVPGKFNILFTMWEAPEVPKSYIGAMQFADLILAPSRFCRDLFLPITNKPVEVCQEGIESDIFPFHRRKFPVFSKHEKFNILWVGTLNPRKGYHAIMEIAKLIEAVPKLQLYIKITAQKELVVPEYLKLDLRCLDRMRQSSLAEWFKIIGHTERFYVPEIAGKIQVFGKHKNIIFDARKLSFNKLAQIYNSTHVFLMPHRGEGWCLPLAEAMATGCPCVATGVSGCMDFFDETVGFPVKYKIKEKKVPYFHIKRKVFVPDTKDLIGNLWNVYDNYQSALEKGKQASARMHTEFTWKKSARRLYEIIKKAQDGCYGG